MLFFSLFVAPVILWARFGESYLARTERVPADTLVVESWIQEDGLHAAAAEFRSGGYRHLVTTGGLTGSPGTVRRRSYSRIAELALVDAGIPREAIIAASAPDVAKQRTFTTAVGVQRALQLQGIHPAAINIFTEGAHARRSRWVYARVFGPNVKTGVISWTAWDPTRGTSWWTSSQRTLVLIKETLGFPYEVLFSSGRSRDS
jgi:hypothetical protein